MPYYVQLTGKLHCYDMFGITESNRPKTRKSHVLLLMYLNYPYVAWNNVPKFHENCASSF